MAHLSQSFALENVSQDDQAKKDPSGTFATNHLHMLHFFRVSQHI
jgi:hypothetical protein